MTIASKLNAMAVANGGTADKSGTITGALDALNDALAGSDYQTDQSTIETALDGLGANIGGGGSALVPAYIVNPQSVGEVEIDGYRYAVASFEDATFEFDGDTLSGKVANVRPGASVSLLGRIDSGSPVPLEGEVFDFETGDTVPADNGGYSIAYVVPHGGCVAIV